MKHLLRVAAVCAVIATLASCDLCKYPIDDAPAIKPDARLLGKWKVKEAKTKGRDLYTLTERGDNKYLVTIRERERKRTVSYDAFLSDVSEARFLNVQYAEDSTKGYVLLRILNINDAANVITATFVADSTIIELNSSAAVRERVAAHLNDKSFYKDTVHFIKVR